MRAGELTGLRLVTLHNLWFIARLMDDLRAAVDGGQLTEVAAELRGGAVPGEFVGGGAAGAFAGGGAAGATPAGRIQGPPDPAAAGD